MLVVLLSLVAISLVTNSVQSNWLSACSVAA